MKLHTAKYNFNGIEGTQYLFFCPACGNAHGPVVPRWSFNGDLEKPTFSPSILAKVDDRVCHSYVTDGKIQYLDDCSHNLRGQTIDLPDFDDIWKNT